MDPVSGILSGGFRDIARLIRLIEDRPDEARPILKQLYRHTGRAFVVGLTGAPGVGKSTLVDRLITAYRGRGLKVAVAAVDPTSPFSGGAVLGDRIRMQNHFTDPGVFIRSLATRGAFGGLSPAVRGVVQVLDAAGFDIILIETVGVGQDEVDVVRLAMTTVVITVPGLGDEVQAIKAGIMEIADLLVVNKADLPGAEQTVNQLKAMIDLNRITGRQRGWWPEVLAVSARTDEGLDELLAGLDLHRRYLTDENPEAGRVKRRQQTAELILDLVKERVLRRTQTALAHNPDWEARLDRVLDRSLDPYTVAEELAGE